MNESLGGSLLTDVCVHLDGLSAEHTFGVWDTVLGHMSCDFHFHIKAVFISTLFTAATKEILSRVE